MPGEPHPVQSPRAPLPAACPDMPQVASLLFLFPQASAACPASASALPPRTNDASPDSPRLPHKPPAYLPPMPAPPADTTAQSTSLAGHTPTVPAPAAGPTPPAYPP